MEYRIQELDTPTKIYKHFYLFDLGFVMIYFFVFMLIGQGRVHPALSIPYYCFNAVIAIILTMRSPWNRGKRIFHSIYFFICKDRCVYFPIGMEQFAEEIVFKPTENENGKEEEQ